MSVFCCPICREPFATEGNIFRCTGGHSFDRASEGYLHLLPVQKKHSLHPGDDPGMVRARRDFLNTGAYRLFSDSLNEILFGRLGSSKNAVLLDAGCGEGYYTERLYSDSHHHGLSWTVAGFDISKSAVRLAAKRSRSVEWAVAGSHSIPVPDGCADGLTAVFSPIVPDEFRRVLRSGGIMMIAVPSERHLIGLKEILYEDVYENESIETEYKGFRRVGRIPVRGELSLRDPAMIRNLLTMTPYFWKTPVSGKERLDAVSELKSEIGFDFLIYEACGT